MSESGIGLFEEFRSVSQVVSRLGQAAVGINGVRRQMI